MSEPPPGAVLMMNSTGFVGGTIATAPGVPPADAATEGAAVAPPPVPLQAVATTRPAIASEIDRPIGFRIRCDLPLFLREADTNSSLVRPDLTVVRPAAS